MSSENKPVMPPERIEEIETEEEIREEDENYLEAERLLRILRCVKSLKNWEDISNNSIMREFLGGGIWVK